MARASQRQRRLAKVLHATSGHIRAEDAAEALDIERNQAAKLLASWHNQGVLRRVARGLYVAVSPGSLGKEQVLDDPWELVGELYAPGYIGGWSALEHWELTEQLFRTVCVFTAKRVANKDVRHQGVSFHLKHVQERKIFGTKTLWRGTHKIQISDPHKTILDITSDPYLGAGLQHTIDCAIEYRKQMGDSQSFEQLYSYAKRLNAGSVFKKLGYIAEIANFPEDFIVACANQMTTGYTYLDKSASKQRLITRWRLWVPEGAKS